jgi:uncharacterized membrane protein YgaE (UPF0421/DUF939 family)
LNIFILEKENCGIELLGKLLEDMVIAISSSKGNDLRLRTNSEFLDTFLGVGFCFIFNPRPHSNNLLSLSLAGRSNHCKMLNLFNKGLCRS